MMTHRSTVACGAVIAGLLWLGLQESWAFWTVTHQALNTRAAEVSSLDVYLKSELQILDGLDAKLKGREVRLWTDDGGAAEDQYFGNETPLGALNRSKHHFHNVEVF